MADTRLNGIISRYTRLVRLLSETSNLAKQLLFLFRKSKDTIIGDKFLFLYLVPRINWVTSESHFAQDDVILCTFYISDTRFLGPYTCINFPLQNIPQTQLLRLDNTQETRPAYTCLTLSELRENASYKVCL